MATPTYSVAITGAPADQLPNLVQNLSLPDAEAGRNGSRLNSMAQNTPMLCKGPDGQLAWYTFDAERSSRGNVHVLKKV